MSTEDTFPTFVRRSRKPSLAADFDFAKHGLLGGASCDFTAMGKQAGEMAVRLLKGEEMVRDLPMEDSQAVLITFNTARAEMPGIPVPMHYLGAARIFTEIPTRGRDRGRDK